MDNAQKNEAIGTGDKSVEAASEAMHALDRIESALARLERLIPTCVGQSADLRRRHKDLKISVTQSLSGLDELLASGSSGSAG